MSVFVSICKIFFSVWNRWMRIIRLLDISCWWEKISNSDYIFTNYHAWWNFKHFFFYQGSSSGIYVLFWMINLFILFILLFPQHFAIVTQYVAGGSLFALLHVQKRWVRSDLFSSWSLVALLPPYCSIYYNLQSTNTTIHACFTELQYNVSLVELGPGEKTPVWFDRKVCLFVCLPGCGLNGNPDKT